MSFRILTPVDIKSNTDRSIDRFIDKQMGYFMGSRVLNPKSGFLP